MVIEASLDGFGKLEIRVEIRAGNLLVYVLGGIAAGIYLGSILELLLLIDDLDPALILLLGWRIANVRKVLVAVDRHYRRGSWEFCRSRRATVPG